RGPVGVRRPRRQRLRDPHHADRRVRHGQRLPDPAQRLGDRLPARDGAAAMRSRTNLPVFLGYTAICLVVLAVLGTQMGGEFLLRPVYRASAVFAGGAQLVPGDDVTINGFRVGRVESLRPVQDGALADLQLHSEYAPLYRDARAMVKSKNLLGETYVE